MMERAAQDAFAAALQLESVALDANFFELGGDSLSLLQLLDQLEAAWGVTLTRSSFLEDPTPRGVARRLSGVEHVDRPAVFPLITRGKTAPLFMVVAGYGDLISFKSLADSLGPGHPVYACQPPDDTGQSGRALLDFLVASYIRGIQGVQPVGPYHLCGYSVGGLVALEVAAELRARGHEIASLTLLDTWPWISASEYAGVQLSRWIFHLALEDHPWVAGRVARVVQFVVRDRGFDRHVSAVRGKPPPQYRGPLTLIMPRLSLLRIGPWSQVWRWRARGQLTLHRVAGDHENFIRPPHVAEVASILRRALLTSTPRA